MPLPLTAPLLCFRGPASPEGEEDGPDRGIGDLVGLEFHQVKDGRGGPGPAHLAAVNFVRVGEGAGGAGPSMRRKGRGRGRGRRGEDRRREADFAGELLGGGIEVGAFGTGPR